MTSVTILTIAKLAQVSHTTVSRALNDSPLVKEATKVKIRAIAKDLGYTPNINARGLAQQRSFLIGLFFSEMKTGTSPSFLVDVLSQIKERLPKGYIVSLDSIDHYRDDGVPVGRYDGIVVVSQSPDDDQFIEAMVTSQVPMVVLNRPLQRRDLSNYSTNDYEGAELLLEYVVRMGHRKLGIISGQEKFVSTVDRKQGFMDVVNKHQLVVNTDWVQHGDYLPESGYRAMRQLLSAAELPTCVFVANDDMAIGAIRACEDMGFRVPQDISVVGYDDMGYSKYLVPRLTTVLKPTSQIVNEGVGALTRLLENETNKADQKIFSPELVVRDSVNDLRSEMV